MGSPTAINSHVSVVGKVVDILTILKKYWYEFQQLPIIFFKSVENTTEKQAAGNGNLTRHYTNRIMVSHQE